MPLGQLTPCLCGTTDTSKCTTGQVTPNGLLYETYACDFNAASGATIFNDFLTPTFGDGMANSIVQCLEAFATASSVCCSCNGIAHKTCALQQHGCGLAVG